jgi:uncharacterized damage-inducible protein DinB
MKMKELLKQYAAYSIWASQKIMDILVSLPADQQLALLPSSFTSLYKTVLHMWDAESIWWQRMKLHERIIRPSDNFKGSMKDVSDGLINQSKQWEDWIASASELSIEHVFQYQTTEGQQFKQPVWQMLLHVFNHGSYHRGQLINMLRQLGVEKLPATDFIIWSRSKK